MFTRIGRLGLTLPLNVTPDSISDVRRQALFVDDFISNVVPWSLNRQAYQHGARQMRRLSLTLSSLSMAELMERKSFSGTPQTVKIAYSNRR